jgi:hypothetical protein
VPVLAGMGRRFPGHDQWPGVYRRGRSSAE